MALKRLSGTCYLKRDGVQYALQGGLTIDPLGVTREAMVGLDGPHGFKETPRMPTITATVTKTPELSITALQGVTDSTITAECADGTVYVLSEAFQSGDISFNAADGTLSITFTGRKCTEIGA